MSQAHDFAKRHYDEKGVMRGIHELLLTPADRMKCFGLRMRQDTFAERVKEIVGRLSVQEFGMRLMVPLKNLARTNSNTISHTHGTSTLATTTITFSAFPCLTARYNDIAVYAKWII